MATQAAEGVFCYSGKEYADRPVAILLDGDRLEVSEIITSWRTPQGKRFRVVTAGGRVFNLSYFEAGDAWKIEEQ